MNIEAEVFKRCYVDFKKLINYGFKEENKGYLYSKNILNNTFKIEINIDKSGNVKGKIYDLEIGEEYTNFRVQSQDGIFVNNIRESYKNILEDIKINCFNNKKFIYPQTNRIVDEIYNIYKDEPEFLWKKYPGFGVFRNKDNKKWYAAIMNIDKSKITKGIGEIEIINLKLNNDKSILKDGIYEAYHMNKKNWITIILDNTLY